MKKSLCRERKERYIFSIGVVFAPWVMESPTALERRPLRLSRYRELVEDKYGLLSPYRGKFVFEDKETFDYKGWYDSDKEEDDFQISNAHGTIKRFLQQLRESGVTIFLFNFFCDYDFINSFSLIFFLEMRI